MVYAHLIAGRDQKEREEFDAELYAPAGGWASVDARLRNMGEGVD